MLPTRSRKVLTISCWIIISHLSRQPSQMATVGSALREVPKSSSKPCKFNSASRHNSRSASQQYPSTTAQTLPILACSSTWQEKSHPRRYSTVFNTTTLACLQRMDLRGTGLSFAQKEAIRALKYDTSCKIAIRFKTNWWKRAGIVCGEAATDLPIGLCVYPSYNINDGVGKPVVLLC